MGTSALPAPILYAAPAEIEVVVPFGAPTSGNTTVSVLRDGNLVGSLTNMALPTNPWLFSVDGTGYGASAWNQDGTPNSPDNPAHDGEIVTYYATGAGIMNPAPPDGTVPSSPFAVPVNSVGVSGRCIYIGDAPGQVEGVIQANCRATLIDSVQVQPVIIDAPPLNPLVIHNVIYMQ